MTYAVILGVCFFSCVIGAICGIGGGVIIKPVLDATGLFSVSTASFLSGCTVLAMSGYNVIKSIAGGDRDIDLRRGTLLGLGAALGGLAGKSLFQLIARSSSHPGRLGSIQAGALFVVVGITLLYTVNRSRLRTHQLRQGGVCILAGFVLGLISAFLGIGGGPMNLMVLSFCFSLPTKLAAQNSLYIIVLSQSSSLLTTVLTGAVPSFSWPVLLAMILVGICGGAAGRRINRRIEEPVVDKLFLSLMVLIMGICIYNFVRYL